MMFLSWLPVIGPIFDGLFGWLNKKEDTVVAKYKVDGAVRKTETVESTKILQTFADDISIRFARDILIFPWALYGGVSGWDYLVSLNHPAWAWGTRVVPEASGLAYLPYMVFVFLLGNIGLNMWNSKR